jgi:hypothetical protein
MNVIESAKLTSMRAKFLGVAPVHVKFPGIVQGGD